MQERVYGPDHGTVLVSRFLLGQVHESTGDLVRAEALVGEAHRAAVAELGPDHGLTASIACSLGRIVSRRGDGRRGEALVRACADAFARILPPGTTRDTNAGDLAFALFAQGRIQEADSLLRIGLPATRQQYGPQSAYVRNLNALRAAIDRQAPGASSRKPTR